MRVGMVLFLIIMFSMVLYHTYLFHEILRGDSRSQLHGDAEDATAALQTGRALVCFCCVFGCGSGAGQVFVFSAFRLFVGCRWTAPYFLPDHAHNLGAITGFLRRPAPASLCVPTAVPCRHVPLPLLLTARENDYPCDRS
ncbi:unnamed protein product [Scytosiphon promiscuus]